MKKKIVLLSTALLLIATCITPALVSAQTAYITNTNDSSVSVINVATNTVSATIPVGLYPFGVSVSQDGSASAGLRL